MRLAEKCRRRNWPEVSKTRSIAIYDCWDKCWYHAIKASQETSVPYIAQAPLPAWCMTRSLNFCNRAASIHRISSARSRSNAGTGENLRGLLRRPVLCRPVQRVLYKSASRRRHVRLLHAPAARPRRPPRCLPAMRKLRLSSFKH